MFYEDKKIVSHDVSEEGVVKIETENDSFTVNSWEFEVNKGEEAIDASEARNNRAIYVVDKIYDLIKDLNIPTEEIGFYLQKLMTRMQGVELAATMAAFGKKDGDIVRLKDWEDKL